MTTPLQEIEEQLLSEKGIRLFLKRDDLIHPHISGNKYRKLKYNLEEARKQGRKTVLTFGGAFSNHIYAVAAAGKEFGEAAQLNPGSVAARFAYGRWLLQQKRWDRRHDPMRLPQKSPLVLRLQSPSGVPRCWCKSY